MILVDELSLGLAPVVVKRLVPTIEAVAASGVGVLLIEQFTHVALGLAKNAYVLEGGRIRYRGTAQQLSLPHIANIAGLGEEISIKGTTADSRPQIRKCVGALWDALSAEGADDAVRWSREGREHAANALRNLSARKFEAARRNALAIAHGCRDCHFNYKPL